jgi:Cache 3/Cache 2 fusion domain
MRPLFPSLIAASAEVRPRATKTRLVCGLILAVGFLATPVLMPTAGNAQDTRVAKSMAALKEKTTKLGAPKIEGTEEVGGKEAPALYFGSTKMNNNFTVVDEIAKEGGRGMAATLFAKNGDEYIRVATNVPMPGGGKGGRLELFWPVQRSRQSKRAKHIMATPRSLAPPISPAMNRSKTHRVQSAAFELLQLTSGSNRDGLAATIS